MDTTAYPAESAIPGFGRTAVYNRNKYAACRRRQQSGSVRRRPEQPLSQLFQIPDDFSNEVRLFPLPNLVMFPCNVQPLHIFESRYREMLEDAMMTDRIIALATLQPGYDQNEYYSRPALAPTICVGQITNCEKTEEGTYNLLLVGLKRAIIEEELPPKRSFREAKVRLLQDLAPTNQLPRHKTLARTIVDRLQRLAPSSSDMLKELMKRELSLAELTDILSFHINLELDTKLALLAEADAEARAKLMLEAMPAREANLGDQPPFSMN